MTKTFLTAASAFLISVSLVGAAAAADLRLPVSGAAVIESVGDELPWYASAKIGVALPGTITLVVTPAGFPNLDGEAKFGAGFAGLVAVGKYLSPNVRAEVELLVANNSGQSFAGTFVGGPATSGTLTGSVTTTALMLTGYYEFTDFGDFVPYLSAGIGAANVNSNLTYADPAFAAADGTITGNSTGVAVRVGAGFNYALSDAVDVTVDYSALLGARANLNFNGIAAGNVTADVMGHMIGVGIKAKF